MRPFRSRVSDGERAHALHFALDVEVPVLHVSRLKFYLAARVTGASIAAVKASAAHDVPQLLIHWS